MNETKEKFYRVAGYQAFYLGYKYQDCPIYIETEYIEWWKAGWKIAECEEAE